MVRGELSGFNRHHYTVLNCEKCELFQDSMLATQATIYVIAFMY